MLTGSMTAAAEVLRISQPAVSRLVKEFESALRLKLFRRVGNRLVPQHEAMLLYREVDRFFTGLEHIAKVADDIRTAKAGALRVAAMTALSLGFVNAVIGRFLASRPGVSISLHTENSRNVLQMVAMHHFDLGFVQMEGEHPGVEAVPLPTVDAVCVLPARHPLAGQTVVRVTDLAGLALISLGRSSPLRMRVEAALAAARVKCQRPIETSLAVSVCALVAQGLGVAVIDPFTAAYFGDRGVVRRRFEPRIPFEFAMLFPAHRQRTKLVEEFAAIAQDMVRQDPARLVPGAFPGTVDTEAPVITPDGLG